MKAWVESIPNRNWLIAGFTALVLVSSFVEIVFEFGQGEPLSQMLDDVAMFFFSALILSLVCLDNFKQHKAIGVLQAQLDGMRGKLIALDSGSQALANQYQSIVNKQFEKWQLTPSEQEVALTLIKGLSFREIAELRQTREKTVRQQAASVYRKAGLSGRHELAGWFFEDLFNPDIQVEEQEQGRSDTETQPL